MSANLTPFSSDGGFSTTGNVTGGSAYFVGNAATGQEAIYAGIPGYTPLSTGVVAQFTGDSETDLYSQINFQNIRGNGSADWVATADNGNDTTYYIDMGIAGSSHVDPNFFGDTSTVNDGYLYVVGNDQAGPGSSGAGNLILGSTNGTIKMFVGNTAQANVVQTVSSDGVSIVGNVVADNVLVTASIGVSGVASPAPSISGFGSINSVNFSATGNITGGNVRTTGIVSATGNITGGNLITAGSGGDITMSGGNITGANVISASGTITSSGNTNGTAFAVVGNGAVSNVALGFFPTGNTPAQMAIRDYSTANSIMYFDTTIGSANTGGAFEFRSSNAYTQLAMINSYGVVQPTKPGFRVYGNGVTSVSTTTNTTGVLNGNNWAVDYNQGSYLNSTTGVFTAPVAGLYQVNLIARVANNVAPQAQAVIVKNRTGTASNQVMWETAANCTVNHFGVSTVSKLAVGDTLELQVTVGALTFDVNDNWSVAYLG